MRINNIYWLTIVLAFSLACSTPDNEPNKNSYTIKEIHAEVFLNAETDTFVGRPDRIIASNEKLYFNDIAFRQIISVDMDGSKAGSFGNQGQGPGEYSSPSSFWLFEDGFMVYDYNSFKFISYNLEGEATNDIIVERNPVNPDGFPPNIPMTVEAFSADHLVIPSRGRYGSLFALADIANDELIFAGEAIGDHVESYKHEEVEREFNDGAIPAIFLNSILLSTRSSSIYSLQQTTGLLEKYDHSGELIWAKSIKTDVQKGLFENIAEANQNLGQEMESHQLFNYAHAIDANDKGVAILLNTLEDEPLTVAWISADGSEISLASFPGLSQNEYNRLGSITISPDNSWIYFLNFMDGLVFRAEWSL